MTANQLSVFPPEPTLVSSPIIQATTAGQTDLPNGWQWVKLSDAVTLSSNKYQPKGETKYYVGLEHIEKGTGRISERAQDESISTVKNSFRAGEILYGRLRPYLNKVALAVRDGVCSTDILVLRPKETVAVGYVHYFMLRDKFVNDMWANSIGTTLPRVPTKFVLGYSFPLPPVSEQQRIISKIEELFSEIDAGIREVETALKRLKTYRQAVFYHFLANESWKRLALGKISTFVRNGISAIPDQESGLKILRTNAIRPNSLSLEDIRFLEPKEDYEQYVLDQGDLLFTRYNGSLDYTGVCAVFKQSDDEPIVHPDKLIRVKLDTNLAIPDFVSYSVNSGISRAFVRQRIRTTAGQSGISGADVKAIPIPLPDLATQTQIVQEIKVRLSEADALEKTLRTELLRAERLRQSVLKQAFIGGSTFRQLLKTDVPTSLPV